MARKGEVFECPECNNKQPLNKSASRSVTCIGCETEFAIVQDGEGGKALVPYFNQKNATEN